MMLAPHSQDADNAERAPACPPSAGHSVPQCRPVPAFGRHSRAQCRPCRPSAGHSRAQCRPSAGTPFPQCRPVPAFGLRPALRASSADQCRPCFRVPNAPSHRVHVQASAALPLPA